MKHKIALTILPAVMILFAAEEATASAGSGDTTTTLGGWEKNLVLDFNAAQTAYSDSWVGGEAGTFTWVSNLNGTASRQFNRWSRLRTIVKLSFGQTHSQDGDTKQWRKPRKSTDLIDWENVATLSLGQLVDPYLAFRLESQFLDQSYEPKKRYLNPLKLTYSSGVARLIYKREKDEITSRFGFAVRQLFKKVIIDTVEHATTDSVLVDGGLEWVSDAKLTLHDRVAYVGKLTLFKALFFSKSDEVKGTPSESDWKAIDVNLENGFLFTITRIIAVSFYSQILYDKEITRKARLKQTLGVGVTLKMW